MPRSKSTEETRPRSGFVQRSLRDDPLHTEEEAARQLRVESKTLCNWRSRRDPKRAIPYVKMGGRVLYRQSALEAFVRRCERDVALANPDIALADWKRPGSRTRG